MKPTSHLVRIRPVREDDMEGHDFIPSSSVQAHAILGEILDVASDVEEDLPVGAYVVFRPWRQLQMDSRIGLWTHWMKDNYLLHEDDLLLVLEEW